MQIRAAALAASLLASPATQALDFEFALSGDTADLRFFGDSGAIGGWGGTEIYGGLLFTDEDDYLATFGAMARRPPSQGFPLTAGVGIRGYFGDLDRPDASVAAVAIGGELRYTIPARMPMAVLGELHYAPSITSFADSDEVFDWTVRYQIEIMPDTLLFVQYRDLEIEVDKAPPRGGDYTVVDDPMIGVRFTF